MSLGYFLIFVSTDGGVENKQGAGLTACPLKNLLYQYLHLENSSSRPGSEAF